MPPKLVQHGAQRGANSLTRLNSSLSKIKAKAVNKPKGKQASKKTGGNNVDVNSNVVTPLIIIPETDSRPMAVSPTVAFNVPPSVDEQIFSLTQANRSLQQQVDQLLEFHRQARDLNSTEIDTVARVDAGLDPFSHRYSHSHENSSSERHRILDRMIRHMPEFNGKADDNFESYIVGVDAALVYGSGCTEEQKLAAVKIKIGGDARQVLANCGAVGTVAELISVMRETYGQDQRSLIADVKQKANEPVKVFATRLKTNLKILGWGTTDAQTPNLVSLEFFLNGLLPSLAVEVKRLLPQSLEIAIDYAIQLEGLKTHSSIDVNKSTKSKLNIITSPDQLSSFVTNQTNTNKSVTDKLAALTAQIKETYGQNLPSNNENSNKNSSTNNNYYGNNNRSNRGTHPYNTDNARRYNNNNSNNNHNNQNNRSGKPNRSFSGTCFGCKEHGHTFTECKKITGEKMDEIRSNFSAYLADSRAVQANKNLNSNGVSPQSQ